MEEMQDSALSPMDQLQQLLETAALSANQLDRILAARPRVPIITVHQAKGAEFDTVFLAGLQDDQFPSYLSQKENHLEEEKRTFYVALTRAKRQLICSFCLSLDGRTKKPSRFLSDLPSETVEWL